MQTHYNPIEAGKRIKKVRISRGYNQKQLAGAIGLTASFVSILEGGRRVMSIDTLLGICNTLETTPNHILGYEPVTTPSPNMQQQYIAAIRIYERSSRRSEDLVALMKSLVLLTKNQKK